VTVSVFSGDYAAVYDAVYQDKDYATECDLLERVFRTYGSGPVRRILDLGCGTGNHAVPLAERGYEVVGVDRSPDMLARARARGSSARFELGDLRDVDLGEQFDAVVMMFAVLGYQLTNADVLAALGAARRHLHPGGLFFADAWYGPAVLRERPSDRVKVLDTPAGQVIRVASGELDVRHQLCSVRYHVWRIEDGRVAGETTERHRVRYFFPLELELFVAESGLDLQRLGGFPEIERDPDESTWSLSVVARAV
jgi:SAM-dependent methyltransferase